MIHIIKFASRVAVSVLYTLVCTVALLLGVIECRKNKERDEFLSEVWSRDIQW